MHSKDKSQSSAGPRYIDAPLYPAVPLHLWDKTESQQYRLHPPEERETCIINKSAPSVVQTDGVPAAVPFIREVKAPAGCAPRSPPSISQKVLFFTITCHCFHLSPARKGVPGPSLETSFALTSHPLLQLSPTTMLHKDFIPQQISR